MVASARSMTMHGCNGKKSLKMHGYNGVKSMIMPACNGKKSMTKVITVHHQGGANTIKTHTEDMSSKGATYGRPMDLATRKKSTSAFAIGGPRLSVSI